MALRVFTDRDGHEWNAWLVRPVSGDASPLPARYREGWVCFERTDGAGRCRLPVDQLPPGWEMLPDERLDLLRRVAEQPVNTSTGPSATPDTASEDGERTTDSGPRQTVGPEDD
jgi:hypothetical protein